MTAPVPALRRRPSTTGRATAAAAAPRRRSAPARPASREPVRPELRVVEAPARSSRAPLAVAMAVVVLFGALFANAMFHSVLVSGQERLDTLNLRVEQEQARNQRLRLKVADLESPLRIVRAAERDGMVWPGTITWVQPRGRDGSSVSSTSTRSSDGTTTGSGTDERAAGGASTGSTAPEGR